MLTYKVYTDVGGREVNEDSVGEWDNNGSYCFVLADGLGGHGRGECASAMAVQTALELFETENPETYLDTCFTTAQQNILDEQGRNQELADMKTTMVVLTVDAQGAKWGHIGDSRLYYFEKNKLIGRTLDHSVPQMLVNAGEIKEKDIRGHEDRNRLLRVLGSPWGNHSYELSGAESTKRQAFLLCSDGFWELIEEKTMLQLLKKAATVEEWLDMMVEEVKTNGQGKEMDNNSAIAVWVENE